MRDTAVESDTDACRERHRDELCERFTRIYTTVDEYVARYKTCIGAAVEHGRFFYENFDRLHESYLSEVRSRDLLKTIPLLTAYVPAPSAAFNTTTTTCAENTRRRRAAAGDQSRTQNNNNNNNNTTLGGNHNETTLLVGSSGGGVGISSTRLNFFYQHLKAAWCEEAEINSQREFDSQI